jgi:hypothetical protein
MRKYRLIICWALGCIEVVVPLMMYGFIVDRYSTVRVRCSFLYENLSLRGMEHQLLGVAALCPRLVFEAS